MEEVKEVSVMARAVITLTPDGAVNIEALVAPGLKTIEKVVLLGMLNRATIAIDNQKPAPQSGILQARPFVGRG
jgi:hypothetical protein